MTETKYKVLILIGDVAGGHMAPAKAVKNSMEQKYPEFEVEIMDLFTVADVAPFNTSESSYTLVTGNYALQTMNNFVFWVCCTRIGNYFFTRYACSMLFNSTKAIINSVKPDLVVTNNPIVTGVVSDVKAKANGKGFFSVAQVTDLDIFIRIGTDTSAELVISPSEMATKRLTRWGVDPNRIASDLFTIRPQLADLRAKDEIMTEFNFDPAKKTVAVIGGGVGFNKYLLQAVEKLIADTEYQIILMTGKLNKLADTLELRYKSNPRVRVQRFTDRIQDIYTIADVVVAKPGMSIMLECEIFEKPTVITPWVAMQELGNVNYMLKNPKFRYLGYNWGNLTNLVNELMTAELPEKTSRRSFSETEEIVDRIVKGFQKYKSRSY